MPKPQDLMLDKNKYKMRRVRLVDDHGAFASMPVYASEPAFPIGRPWPYIQRLRPSTTVMFPLFPGTLVGLSDSRNPIFD